MTKKPIFWIALIGIGIVLYAFVSRGTSERPGVPVAVQGTQHIDIGESHPAYNSNPPTSGWHYDTPAPWDFHEQELPDEQLIHNLEHGGIWISYMPTTDSELKAALQVIALKYPNSVVVTPRVANDSLIAVASWGRLLKLDAVDEPAIEAFIKANRNKSPEPLAR